MARPGSLAKKAGLPPGALLYTGERVAGGSRISVLDYDGEFLREKEAVNPEELAHFRSTSSVTWISVNGLQDVGLIEKIGKLFGIHPLVLEDILTTDQRPKMEDHGEYLYMVLRCFATEAGVQELKAEQVSLLVGPSYVISFQESGQDIFRSIRERINSAGGRIRKEGADYLAYSLLDTVVDNYFLVLEELGERIEDLEDALVARPERDALQKIHVLKREMLFFRKALWPLREFVAVLSRGDSPLLKETTVPYIRDVYDHTIHAIETLETYRDIVSGMLDIYLSGVSNRMNKVMKVLTIISTIFMPLTFIAGLYGMNFRYMPELEWRWGYPAVLALMAAVSAGMLTVFRRQKWL